MLRRSEEKVMVVVTLNLLIGLLLFSAFTGDCSTDEANHVTRLLVNMDKAIGTNNKILGGDVIEVVGTRSKLLSSRKLGVVAARGTMGKGADPGTVGKCKLGGKGELNMECELRVRRNRPSSVKLVGLIPFSSDYHTPKTHPPKNN